MAARCEAGLAKAGPLRWRELFSKGCEDSDSCGKTSHPSSPPKCPPCGEGLRNRLSPPSPPAPQNPGPQPLPCVQKTWFC